MSTRHEHAHICNIALSQPLHRFTRTDLFDRRFLPAYFEDTDMAFQIRGLGLRVLYQPFARALHLESLTYGAGAARLRPGTRSSRAAAPKKKEKLMKASQASFVDKYKEQLKFHSKIFFPPKGSHTMISRDLSYTTL